MRITIPWGGIALVGGIIILSTTDWPSIIGWVLVIWGIISLILQILVIAIASITLKTAQEIAPKLKGLTEEEIEKVVTYKTSHGRCLPVKRQVTNVRGVNSKGDVVIDSKQS